MNEGTEVRRLMEQGASRGLAEAAHELLRRAKANVPVGDPDVDPDPNVSLRDSGHVEVELGGRSVTVSFDTPYAARVHENQRLRHPRGGSAKFLEKELQVMMPRLDGILASEVRKLMTGARSGSSR